MKKVIVYLFLILVVILNVYLIIFWQPQGKLLIKEENSKEAVSQTDTVYKLDKKRVLEELSADDRRDFEKIIKKLSTLDIGKIKEYYEDTNDKEGAINILKLLKKRLSSEDYKKIEEISSSFIQMDKINNITKK